MGADEVVLERLEFLRNEVVYLKRERDRTHSFEEYVNNTRLRRAVERSLQVSVEACLDIGRRLIAVEGFRYPEDNKDVFQVLREEEETAKEGVGRRKSQISRITVERRGVIQR